jgi:hypothetical protein
MGDEETEETEMDLECCCGHCPDDMMEELTCMTEEAWAEMMIDKMKAYLEQKRGNQMDKAAKIMVDYAVEYWSAKMKSETFDEAKEKEYEAKVKAALAEEV